VERGVESLWPHFEDVTRFVWVEVSYIYAPASDYHGSRIGSEWLLDEW
jgi:hypothetical protein